MAQVEWKAAQAISIRVVTVILTEEELRDLEVTWSEQQDKDNRNGKGMGKGSEIVEGFLSDLIK